MLARPLFKNLANDNDPFDITEFMEIDDDPDAKSLVNLNAEQPETPFRRPKPQMHGFLEAWELDNSLTTRERREIKVRVRESEVIQHCAKHAHSPGLEGSGSIEGLGEDV